MKILIFLNITYYFFNITSVCFAQKDTLNFTDSKGLKQGKWLGKFETGEKRYEGNFKNNNPVGEFIYFYESGEKNAEIEFSENGKKSKTKYFYPNGKLMGKGNYVNQQKDSVWLYYDDREILSAEENFKEGNKEGISKIYFLDGTISEEKNWRNNVEHGLCKQFFSNGKIKYAANYVDGNPDGKVTFYHSNGQIKSTGIYADAVKGGEWISYNEDATIFTKEMYSKGILVSMKKENGIFKEQYPNGSVKEEISFKNGIKNGIFREFYDMKIEPRDTAKKQTEEWETLYSDIKIFEGQTIIEQPKIKTEGNYLNSKLDGEIIHYKENGAIEKVEIYKNGILIKKK